MLDILLENINLFIVIIVIIINSVLMEDVFEIRTLSL